MGGGGGGGGGSGIFLKKKKKKKGGGGSNHLLRTKRWAPGHHPAPPLQSALRALSHKIVVPPKFAWMVRVIKETGYLACLECRKSSGSSCTQSQ